MTKQPTGASRKGVKVSKPLPRWPLALVMVVVLLVAGFWLVGQMINPASLPVNTIRIESPLKQLSNEDIRNAVRPHVSSGFLKVDVDEIRRELEALPWVSSASVRREWPDLLVVRVEEQKAVARWSNGGLLNARGELFMPPDTKQWEVLPLLRGPVHSEVALMKEYQAMQGMLAPLGLRISHLTMNERRAWSLNLQGGLLLRLGRREIHTRLLRFVRVFARVLKPQLKKMDIVDLRYTNGFAVRWRGNNSAAA